VNQKLRYTHGYGIAASPVAKVEGEGLPSYTVKDIPPVGDIPVKQPGIYFGQVTSNYVLAPSAQPEFDFPQGTDNANTSYSGTHGVRMDGNTRALWSLRTGDFNLLISDQIQNRTQMLFRRNIADRLQAIAPFLTYDAQPYIVVADGRLYWVVDAYTQDLLLPLLAGGGRRRDTTCGTRSRWSSTPTRGRLTSMSPTRRIRSCRRTEAPSLSLFKPIDSMPKALQSHLRVPEHLFTVQADVYRLYHISNPQTFYNREDVWRVPDRAEHAQHPGSDPPALLRADAAARREGGGVPADPALHAPGQEQHDLLAGCA